MSDMSNRDDSPTIEPKFAPLCIWCSAPWSDDNVRLENAYASFGCPTCGDYSIDGGIVIRCHECEKIVYKKNVTYDR